MAASSGVLPQVFFVYDHDAMKTEEDDPKDAIVYFYPSSMKVGEQVVITGQFMGTAEYCYNLFNTSPQLYKLKGAKVAVRRCSNISLALGGDLNLPDSALQRQLETIHDLLVFYFQSIQAFIEDHRESNGLQSPLHHTLDSFLLFVRHYGDHLAAMFDPMLILELPKTGQHRFLEASQLLQSCQRHKDVMSGCLLHKHGVLCTHLTSDLTNRLLLIRPNQSHLPCNLLDTDFIPPDGVRLIRIYLKQEEYESLHPYKRKENGIPTDPCSMNTEGSSEPSSSLASSPDTQSSSSWGQGSPRTAPESPETVNDEASEIETKDSVVTQAPQVAPDGTAFVVHITNGLDDKGGECNNGNKVTNLLQSVNHEHGKAEGTSLKNVGAEQCEGEDTSLVSAEQEVKDLKSHDRVLPKVNSDELSSESDQHEAHKKNATGDPTTIKIGNGKDSQMSFLTNISQSVEKNGIGSDNVNDVIEESVLDSDMTIKVDGAPVHVCTEMDETCSNCTRNTSVDVAGNVQNSAVKSKPENGHSEKKCQSNTFHEDDCTDGINEQINAKSQCQARVNILKKPAETINSDSDNRGVKKYSSSLFFKLRDPSDQSNANSVKVFSNRESPSDHSCSENENAAKKDFSEADRLQKDNLESTDKNVMAGNVEGNDHSHVGKITEINGKQNVGSHIDDRDEIIRDKEDGSQLSMYGCSGGCPNKIHTESDSNAVISTTRSDQDEDKTKNDIGYTGKTLSNGKVLVQQENADVAKDAIDSNKASVSDTADKSFSTNSQTEINTDIVYVQDSQNEVDLKCASDSITRESAINKDIDSNTQEGAISEIVVDDRSRSSYLGSRSEGQSAIQKLRDPPNIQDGNDESKNVARTVSVDAEETEPISTSSSSDDLDLDSDSDYLEDDLEDDLVAADVYVQSCSSLVLLLLLEAESTTEDRVKALHDHCHSPLEALNNRLEQSLREAPAGGSEVTKDYHYLTFDNLQRNLSGNMLHPVSAQENSFCHLAGKVHEEFVFNKKLHDLTLRKYGTCVFGHRNAGFEIFLQPVKGQQAKGREHPSHPSRYLLHQLELDMGGTVV